MNSRLKSWLDHIVMYDKGEENVRTVGKASIYLIVDLISLNDLLKGSFVNLIRGLSNRCYSTRRECFTESLGIEAQVCQHTEASEALTEDRPLLQFSRVLSSKGFPHSLAIFDDAVCSKELEIVRLSMNVALQS
jgi:hypothetical protein